MLIIHFKEVALQRIGFFILREIMVYFNVLLLVIIKLMIMKN